MRKTLIAVLILLLALFTIVTLLKRRPAEVISENGGDIKTVAEKQRIQHFWEVYRKATEFRITGVLDSAAAKYRKAIELNNRHEDALYYLGNMYFELGEFDAAEQIWKRW